MRRRRHDDDEGDDEGDGNDDDEDAAAAVVVVVVALRRVPAVVLVASPDGRVRARLSPAQAQAVCLCRADAGLETIRSQNHTSALRGPVRGSEDVRACCTSNCPAPCGGMLRDAGIF